MSGPSRRAFRPGPLASPSRSLEGLERFIPPGQRPPGRSRASRNFDKPLPELPEKQPSQQSFQRNSIKRVHRFPHEDDFEDPRARMTLQDAQAYDRRIWEEADANFDSKMAEVMAATSYVDELMAQERAQRMALERSQCVSWRGFLTEPSEADIYMGNTPVRANPYAQEKKRTTGVSEPEGPPEFQTAATNDLGQWRMNKAGKGSGFAINTDGMSRRSLVPAPLNLSQERITPEDSNLSRFSSTSSEENEPHSASIRDSVKSYVRKKLSQRKPSSKKKGKQPAVSVESMESMEFEGRIPPHYTHEYDIQPKARRSAIQRGVADLDKRMGTTSVSYDSDMGDYRYSDHYRCSDGYGYGNGYRSEPQRGYAIRESRDSRACGSCPPPRQQLAVPTSPYQKYGPKIWESPKSEERKRKRETTKSNNKKKNKKSRREGDGDGETLGSRIMSKAFRRGSKGGSTAAEQLGGISGPVEARSSFSQQQQSRQQHRSYQSHTQRQSHGRTRGKSQAHEPSEYVAAFQRGTTQVISAVESAKTKLGLTGREERRRQDLKDSIVVVGPVDPAAVADRDQMNNWV